MAAIVHTARATRRARLRQRLQLNNQPANDAESRPSHAPNTRQAKRPPIRRSSLLKQGGPSDVCFDHTTKWGSYTAGEFLLLTGLGHRPQARSLACPRPLLAGWPN
jgi:hypothetical protein